MEYDAAYFKRRDRYVITRKACSRALHQLWQPSSVLDIGCGQGLMMLWWADHYPAIPLRGFDKYADVARPYANRKIRNLITTCDLEEDGWWEGIAKWDLVICAEVAEHLKPEAGEGLVKGLTECGDRIFFTAAPPEQISRGHINLRPYPYWIALFRQHHFINMPLVTKAWQALLPADIGHSVNVRDNAMFFRRMVG